MTKTTTLIQIGPITVEELPAYRDALMAAVINLEDQVAEARAERRRAPNSDYWDAEQLRRKKALSAAQRLCSKLYHPSTFVH